MAKSLGGSACWTPSHRFKKRNDSRTAQNLRSLAPERASNIKDCMIRRAGPNFQFPIRYSVHPKVALPTSIFPADDQG